MNVLKRSVYEAQSCRSANMYTGKLIVQNLFANTNNIDNKNNNNVLQFSLCTCTGYYQYGLQCNQYIQYIKIRLYEKDIYGFLEYISISPKAHLICLIRIHQDLPFHFAFCIPDMYKNMLVIPLAIEFDYILPV